GAVGEGDPTDPAAAPGIGASPVAAVGPARWGYPAPWASGGKVLFNARGETVFDKRSFAGSEPCLVVMNGWYEWFRPGGGSGGASQPYLTTEPGEGYREGDGEGDDAAPLLVVAGLCRTVAREGAGTQGAAGTDTAPAGQDGAGDGSGAGAAPATELRMTVVTTASAEPVGWLHDRMPRLLTPAEARDWLAGTPGDERLRDLAATPPHRPGLRSRPVSTAVGNVGNNDPGLLRPVTDGDTPR
ncbi:SOS response-associated peptidase, partial [Corynebacterium bovis]